MTERVLFLCTANVCRSPMAETILREELRSRGSEVEVYSAGFLSAGSPVDDKAMWVMNKLGFDLSAHVSATVAAALGRHPDLILVMAREHLRTLSQLTPDTVSQAFTLKEFIRLAEIEGGRRQGEPLAHYVDRVGAGRSPFALTSPGTEGDVEDPIGRRKSAFVRCANELQCLARKAAVLLCPIPE